MKKYDLKLCKDNVDKDRIRVRNNKNDNILSIGVWGELVHDKVCLFYNENDIKRCGFDKINKVEIYKDSELICYEDKISNFRVEFPYFSLEGTYEIRSIISNSSNNSQTCIINTFEFFNYKREVKCDNFKLNLSKDNKNLNINFNKKFGDNDLSDINLSNITLFDSNNNQIKNIACKIYSKLNTIDFIILDIFDDNNSNKLIPNEVYTLKITLKDKEFVSSFSFEYGNIEMNAYKVIENIEYEVISSSEEALSLKLYLKINSLINADDYDYFISNIRNKFLYFKCSEGHKEDTVVFECIIKKDKNYFELSICKGSSVNIIKFDYDFIGSNSVIKEREYFKVPSIERVLSKYTIKVFPMNSNMSLNKSPFLGISDKFGQLGISFTNKNFVEQGEIINKDDSSLIIFENITILNKFSEVYTIELDYEFKGSFIFSPSIGVKFNQINYDTKFLNENLYIEFKDNGKNGKGKYFLKKGEESTLNILNNTSKIKMKDLGKESILVYLLLYDEFNKVYLETINLNYEDLDAFIKIYRSEKFILDSLNYLTIIDKNIFDEFREDFSVSVLNENLKNLQKIHVSKFNPKYKISFDNIQINSKGMNYIKVSKGKNYKICSFFIENIIEPKTLFIKNLNKNGMEVLLSNFKLSPSKGENIKVNIFLLVDNVKHLFIEQSFSISSEKVKIDFLQNVLINNTEYLAYFEFDKNRRKSVRFTYLGEDFFSNNIYEDINELNKALEYEKKYLLNNKTFIIDKVGKIFKENYLNEEFESLENEDVNSLIKNGYEIFLGFNIEEESEEFKVLRELIYKGKIDLSYFIEIFILEYVLRFIPKDERDYVNLLNRVMDFLNSKEGIIGKIKLNIVSLEGFIYEVLKGIQEISEYKIINKIFNSYRI